MDQHQSKVIAAALANDENSTDQDLLSYFTSEIGITEAEALACISRRGEYLR